MRLTPGSSSTPSRLSRDPGGLARRACAVLALLAGAGVAGHSQQPTQLPEAVQPSPKPTFHTEANYVRVDVYPTVDGVPVSDLTRDDFELFEDGAPQKLEQFELIEVLGNIPQESRREPQTVAESRAMAQDPRSRVFIVFLDTYHTDVFGSHRMRTALATMLNRLLGADDLVGVMTPEMSPRDVTLARRTEVTEGMLSKYWTWGRRHQIASLDPEEEAYLQCYPTEITTTTTGGTSPRVTLPGDEKQYAGVAQEMIERRREKLTLDAIDNLVLWLRDIREERKAVLTITDGWRLFKPNEALTRAGKPPTLSGLGTGPTGGLTADVGSARTGIPQSQCDRDRLYLASLDNELDFRLMLDRANRSNVTFYPIDSRGLPVFDEPIGGVPGTAGLGPLTVTADSARLTQRISTLQTLAAATDGIAVVNSNDIERGLRRVVADLSTYYLLGYYSSNSKLDGRFRAIKVRVKRPGVSVRARRGYLAATEKEMEMATPAAPPPMSASAAALERALGGLAGLRPDARVRTHVAWLAPSESSSPNNHVWAIAELDRAVVKGAEWTSGAKIEATLAASDGTKVATSTVDLAAGQRSAAIDMADVALPSGELVLRMRISPAGGGLPLVESLRFTVADSSSPIGSPRLWRRGPETGPQFVLTGNSAFRRSDTMRFEVPVAGAVDSVTAELLDRTGKTMSIPVTTRVKTDSPELSWAIGELALAPLSTGDYAVRTTVKAMGSTREILTAFRMVQ